MKITIKYPNDKEDDEYKFSISESKLHLTINDPTGAAVVTLDKTDGKIFVRSGDDLKHKFVWMPDNHNSYKLEFIRDNSLC